VRLRPLTEAECYARCYGGRHDESVSLVSDEELLDRAAGPAARREPLDGTTIAEPAKGREAA
jgi:hypothetical protein